jgi:hypothetical protein
MKRLSLILGGGEHATTNANGEAHGSAIDVRGYGRSLSGLGTAICSKGFLATSPFTGARCSGSRRPGSRARLR